MTFVLSLTTRDRLWMVADRRLSYNNGAPPKDSASKVVRLDTHDGVGLLAYAGLGATARGTEPSSWMSSTLRGRGELSFEESLGVLATVAAHELPPHLAQIPGHAHFIIASAFLKSGGSRRVFSVENVFDPGTKTHRYRFVKWSGPNEAAQAPAIGMTGSGGIWLIRQPEWLEWRRELLSAARARDRDKVTDRAVADKLAAINFFVSQRLADGTVGPTSIVVWTRRPGSPGDSVNSHAYYSGVDRVQDLGKLPSIQSGMDMLAFAEAVMPDFQRALANIDWSRENPMEFEPDVDALNRRLANIPRSPNESLE